MDDAEFRKQAIRLVDYTLEYNKNIEQRQVMTSVEPGFLKKLIPKEAPVMPEPFSEILKDIDTKIMPGMVHWNHPRFLAYFPASNSYPSILAEMLNAMFGTVGFSWASSPAMTELEVIMMNWYGRALNLPEHYLTDIDGSKAGACLQNSASDCIFSCLMAARARAIKKLKGGNTEVHDSVYLPNLVAYASKEAHSSTEKACLMALCKLHVVETDEEGVLRGQALRDAIEEDVEAGLTPFFVVATIGTTAGCIFDNLAEIGPVCKKFPSIWFHVDGAYAGNSLILPEMRYIANGLEYSDSFNTNANKFMLTNFDCSLMWVRNAYELTSALAIDPLYLQHEHSGGVIDFRHYGIPLSRRFRALKLWFVFRTYGISGLQKFQRNHIALAKRFEQHVLTDDRFEVVNKVDLGLVCFRLRDGDESTKELIVNINASGLFHLTPAVLKNKFIIRLCINYEHMDTENIDYAWKEIRSFAESVLAEKYPQDVKEPTQKPKRRMSRQMSARFSFTQDVSREDYNRRNSKGGLFDLATPLFVMKEFASDISEDLSDEE